MCSRAGPDDPGQRGRRRRIVIPVLIAAVVAGAVVALLMLDNGDDAGESQPPTPRLRRVSPLDGSMRPGERVLVGSPQVRTVLWSATDAEFVLECRNDRPIELVVLLSELPADLRYEWVVITGDANQHEPLRSDPAIEAEVKNGSGEAANFAPVAGPGALLGRARVDFRFAPSQQVTVDRIALLVRDKSVYESYVLSAPRAICERS